MKPTFTTDPWLNVHMDNQLKKYMFTKCYEGSAKHLGHQLFYV